MGRLPVGSQGLLQGTLPIRPIEKGGQGDRGAGEQPPRKKLAAKQAVTITYSGNGP